MSTPPPSQQPPEDNRQPHLFLMSHTSLPRRTADGARQLRENFTNVMREISPLVETARNAGDAMSIANLLNRTPQETIVIDIDPEAPPENDAQPNEQNNLAGATLETQQFLQSGLRYVPFILILLAKSVYDFHDAIFILIVLFATFVHTNAAVKKETTKRHRRSLWTLSVELLYIMACCAFVHFVFAGQFHDFDVLMNMVFVRTFVHPLTTSNLLWVVLVTDFALKLVTVGVKIVLTMLPGRLVPFKKRVRTFPFIIVHVTTILTESALIHVFSG